jgi:hypothetical protein
MQVVSRQLVVRLGGAHAAEQRRVPHQPGELGKVLADLDARHRGLDRPKLAADVGRRLGLEIEGVDVARPARHPKQDARFRLRLLGRLRGESRQPTVQRASAERGARRGAGEKRAS